MTFDEPVTSAAVSTDMAGPDASSAASAALAQNDQSPPAVAGPPQEQIRALLDQAAQHAARQRLPVSTYRLQFNAGLKFRQVETFVDYFSALGITDLYASPLLQAREGSTSGYDVVDCSAINGEIGTADELASLVSALHERGLGLILDVVPNHMGTASTRNRWWQDVLENGPSSLYATYFDIDWDPPKPDLSAKVMLPVLGDQFGRVLEDARLAVVFQDGAFWLHYYDSRFPLSPNSYAAILDPQTSHLQQTLGEQHADLLEFLSILTAIRNLPPLTSQDRLKTQERQREKEIIKRRLKELVERSEVVRQSLDANLRELNGTRGNPRSFDRLEELLEQQAFRLSYWRVAADEINYRRFFDINELAAICVELREVFEGTHALILDLIDKGLVGGLRIDHPDGLFDPSGYLWQLQEERMLQLCRRAYQTDGEQKASDEWKSLAESLRTEFRRRYATGESPPSYPLYVVVEKILGHDEQLPLDWPVQGTVGYKYLNRVSGLFVDPAGERPISTAYARFTGESLDFRELAYLCKRLIVRMSMAAELTVLGQRLDRISERNRWSRDFTRSSLTRALQEIVACFSVYRTYVSDGHITDRDRHYIESAVARAKRRNPAMNASTFDFVRDLLLLKYRENADEEERANQLKFVGKFQQLSGPIMAKAVEDTAFYRFNRLVSLNEVGGEPERFGNSPEAFHQLNQSRLPWQGHGLSSTATHDTKRGEDVRPRIHVLSEVPRQWQQHLMRWGRINRRFKTEVEGQPAPSTNDEYLLYQTLIGIWPDDIPVGPDRAALVDRIQQYMLKVAREAKAHTSWISPHEPYEKALWRFIDDIFQDDKRRQFLSSLNAFAQNIAEHGRWNSLSQLVLKLASPGACDFYQGTELWSLTLVDPDNRRNVDFAARAQMLKDLDAALSSGSPESQSATPRVSLLGDLLEHRRDGRIKLFTTLLGLRIRKAYPELFTTGDYFPLQFQGDHAEHLVGIGRRHGGQVGLAVVPRWTVKLCGFGLSPPIGEIWGNTAVFLPPELVAAQFTGVFDAQQHAAAGGNLLVSRLLREFPVALCTGEAAQPPPS
jgi:(1->4)-alpha-D-glucan 1-alpha-D-glucosylmutase